jgi:ribonuclease P protein component
LTHTFKKCERLNGKKPIQRLFAEGQAFYAYPFRVVFMRVKEKHAYPARLLVSVSRRHFKKASERNLLKRLIRETYRKQKQNLYAQLEGKEGQLHIALVFTAKAIPNYKELETKIILILQRLIERDEPAAG